MSPKVLCPHGTAGLSNCLMEYLDIIVRDFLEIYPEIAYVMKAFTDFKMSLPNAVIPILEGSVLLFIERALQ